MQQKSIEVPRLSQDTQTTWRRRKQLITKLASMGNFSPWVLEAMAKVPRHIFVSSAWLDQVYQEDTVTPIAAGQTLSQPLTVALMNTLALGNKTRWNRALEIGTGTGFQASLMAHLCDELITLERVRSLSLEAAHNLHQQGFEHVICFHSDEAKGDACFEGGFDAIILAAQTDSLTPYTKLLNQGGVLVAPLIEKKTNHNGETNANIVSVRALGNGSYETQKHGGARFVPLLSGKI